MTDQKPPEQVKNPSGWGHEDLPEFTRQHKYGKPKQQYIAGLTYGGEVLDNERTKRTNSTNPTEIVDNSTKGY